jgi:hypothetical protein
VALGYVVPGLRGRTIIRLARHGVRAGVLGAALLAEQEVADINGVKTARSLPRSVISRRFENTGAFDKQ